MDQAARHGNPLPLCQSSLKSLKIGTGSVSSQGLCKPVLGSSKRHQSLAALRGDNEQIDSLSGSIQVGSDKDKALEQRISRAKDMARESLGHIREISDIVAKSSPEEGQVRFKEQGEQVQFPPVSEMFEQDTHTEESPHSTGLLPVIKVAKAGNTNQRRHQRDLFGRHSLLHDLGLVADPDYRWAGDKRVSGRVPLPLESAGQVNVRVVKLSDPLDLSKDLN